MFRVFVLMAVILLLASCFRMRKKNDFSRFRIKEIVLPDQSAKVNFAIPSSLCLTSFSTETWFPGDTIFHYRFANTPFTDSKQWLSYKGCFYELDYHKHNSNGGKRTCFDKSDSILETGSRPVCGTHIEYWINEFTSIENRNFKLLSGRTARFGREHSRFYVYAKTCLGINDLRFTALLTERDTSGFIQNLYQQAFRIRIEELR